MKICWDNLEKLKYISGTWQGKYYEKYYYKIKCIVCEEPFLSSNDGNFCSKSCANSFNGKGRKISEETKEKISKATKKRLLNSENHPNYGKHLSEETKEKIRKANIGYIPSEETKEKIRKARAKQKSSGWKWSEECKEKQSELMKGRFVGKENPFYGKKHTEETRVKISKNMTILSGDKHWNWKGGISCEPYCQDWTKEYKEYIKE